MAKKDINNENVENTEVVEDKKEQKESVTNDSTNNKTTSPIVDENVIRLDKIDETETPFVDQVENERKAVFSLYQLEKRNSKIAMAVAFVLVAAVIVFLTVDIPNGKFIALILSGVILVGLILYYALSKNKFPNATKDYIKKVCILFNRSSYAISELKDPTFDPKERIELNEILAEKVYSPISEISSRNVVHAHYLKSPITISDVALYVPGERKGTKQVVFLGKHISFENDLHFEGRYIIQLRTAENKPTDTPTDISDIVIRYGGADYTVFGVEKSDYKKDVGQKFVDAIRKIEIGGSLLNVNVVIWAGHTAVYLSYDDSVMSIPFEHPYKNESHQLFNNHLKLVLKVLKEIKN